ncbi:hypothetical protein [Streptomyces sp. NPDC088794]|uniref:hypothetical protein n=1 Tax=Streptomyces sp. NPDC088794 TaxID=3365902 RepID=UPI0037FF64F7
MQHRTSTTQHRSWGLIAAGVAAAGLCAVLATTALASSDHGTEPQAGYRSSSTVQKAPAAEGTKASVDAGTDSQLSKENKASPADGTKSQVSEENQQLLEIQREIKVTTGNPTADQITRAEKLIRQLKADGKATADQLAWLKLTPAEKTTQAPPVGKN